MINLLFPDLLGIIKIGTLCGGGTGVECEDKEDQVSYNYELR